MSVVYRFWDGPNYLTVATHAVRRVAGQPAARLRLHADVLPDAPAALSALRAGARLARRIRGGPPARLGARLHRRRCFSSTGWPATSGSCPRPRSSSLVFLFLPPRWLLYRSTGATEALYDRPDARLGVVLREVAVRAGRRSSAALAALTRHLGPHVRSGLRGRPGTRAAMARLAVAPAHPGGALRLLPLLRDPLRRLLRVPETARREDGGASARSASCRRSSRRASTTRSSSTSCSSWSTPSARSACGRASRPSSGTASSSSRLARSRVDGGLEPLLPGDGAFLADRRLPRPDRHAGVPLDVPALRRARGLLRLGDDPAERLPARHLRGPAHAPRAGDTGSAAP